MKFYSNAKFGVEIEFFLDNDKIQGLIDDIRISGVDIESETYNHFVRRIWKLTTDSSCQWEIVSPPMTQNDRGFEQIRIVCGALERAGATVTKKTGLHVHHDLTGYTIDNVRQAVQLYQRFEGAIDELVPPSRRGNVNSYCQSLREVDLPTTARSISDMPSALRTDRYRKVNITSVASYGTLEFRQHSGTTNADKIINWIVFTQNILSRTKTRIHASTKNDFHQLQVVLGAYGSWAEDEISADCAKYLRRRRRELNSSTD